MYKIETIEDNLRIYHNVRYNSKCKKFDEEQINRSETQTRGSTN